MDGTEGQCRRHIVAEVPAVLPERCCASRPTGERCRNWGAVLDEARGGWVCHRHVEPGPQQHAARSATLDRAMTHPERYLAAALAEWTDAVLADELGCHPSARIAGGGPKMIDHGGLAALAGRAAGGDGAAFGQLRAASEVTIAAYLRHKTNAPPVADALVDATFDTAWATIHDYDPTELPVIHWLLRIARNAVIVYYRSGGAAS